jgi:predicted N-acetyltransferase YhbS
VTDIVVRTAGPGDLPAILALLRSAMQRADDDRFESLFRWKHLENAFGPSPMWVAVDGERIAGFRAFLRWEFEQNGRVVRAVRAVDTATDPDYQGRGIFTQLTLQALDDLAADGVEFVFNTPNDQSRPGYLKMGWREIGRARAAVRPTHLGGLFALRRARVPASHWSEPTNAGVAAIDLLTDPNAEDVLAPLLAPPANGALRTRRTLEVLRWRYGTPLLAYRAIAPDGDARRGVAFVRLRRRGAAREAVLAAVLAPDRERRTASTLVRAAARAVRQDADYLLAVGAAPGCVPISKLGPIVTTRTVARPGPDSVQAFDLTLGDIELF